MIRNPRYNADGTIDCELSYPDLDMAWVPFTASPDDPEEFGRSIYQMLIDGQAGPIAPYIQSEPVPLTLEEVQALRRAAYVAESDPLKNEADYDALINGTEPDYTAWIAAVEAIKARYPLPA